ncbi:hypothetical protein KL86DPRO_11849 [uncultured delta proteobacterium]|uniref:Uncharacterized protein n=1 Tax=uncultured delta proteobacterium TaxID=34034 RepID=A0A212JN03_9DELT|nr:hypothetical protein KL86DPRO_11849 [uncultured delta proteobacterium]
MPGSPLGRGSAFPGAAPVVAGFAGIGSRGFRVRRRDAFSAKAHIGVVGLHVRVRRHALAGFYVFFLAFFDIMRVHGLSSMLPVTSLFHNTTLRPNLNDKAKRKTSHAKKGRDAYAYRPFCRLLQGSPAGRKLEFEQQFGSIVGIPTDVPSKIYLSYIQ